MEKVKLELKTPENVKIVYNNVSIEVMPFLSLAQQVYLIIYYIKDYFDKPAEILIENTRYHYLEAECELKNNIIQLNTNIDLTQDIVNDVLADTILWTKITTEIKNWLPFRDTLDRIIYDIRQQETLENSVGTIVSSLVEKGYALLDKLANLNPEEIKKVGEEGQKLIERLEKSSVLNNLSDKIAIAENAGLVKIEEKAIEKAKQIKTRKPRTKKAK